MLNYLASRGVAAVSEDSSGNAGAALATYCAAAAVDCRIYVPDMASPAKIAQIAATGSQIVRISGSRQAVTDAAMEDASGAYYASHNWHPMFLEGTKTVGFEIWEQLQRAPDVIVAPVGGGSNLIGCFKAFGELRASGLVDRVPKLIGVQSSACEPLAQAFRDGREEFAPIEARPTVAEGIAVSRPVRSREVLSAVRASGGSIISVSEDAIVDAHRMLARRGLYVEPTSATAVAGLRAVLVSGEIGPDLSIVVILTGSGLKAGAPAL
jgi:threonine synthase